MSANSVKGIGAGILAVVAVILMGASLRTGCRSLTRYNKADANLDSALTGRLAKEVSSQQEPGKVVLIRFVGFIPSTQEVQTTQVETFTRELEGSGWEVVDLPPADINVNDHGTWAVRCFNGEWGQYLQQWLAPHEDAVAVVSLVGVPKLPAAAWKQLPAVYASVPSMDPYLEQLLTHGQVSGLAVLREDGSPAEIRSFRGSAEKLFDMAYEYKAGKAAP